jgi:ABC-2 type transport system permease protein
MFSALSPAIALQHVSASLAGTDIAAHRHFALEAERQRALIVRAMNEDMMLNGAKQGDAYVAGAALWQRIPDFVYRPPSLSFALRAARWDFLVLGLWGVMAVWLAWRASSRQQLA